MAPGGRPAGRPYIQRAVRNEAEAECPSEGAGGGVKTPPYGTRGTGGRPGNGATPGGRGGNVCKKFKKIRGCGPGNPLTRLV